MANFTGHLPLHRAAAGDCRSVSPCRDCGVNPGGRLRFGQDQTMSTPFSYQDKRVVVTGGTTGVGAALVELLESLDAAHIVVLDLKKPSGPVDTYLQVDLADPASIDAAIDAIEGPIDALFNNAGVAATLPGPTVMAVNYLALRRLSERLLPRISTGGAIANTASIAGGQCMTRLAEITELLAVEGWAESLEWLAAHPS